MSLTIVKDPDETNASRGVSALLPAHVQVDEFGFRRIDTDGGLATFITGGSSVRLVLDHRPAFQIVGNPHLVKDAWPISRTNVNQRKLPALSFDAWFTRREALRVNGHGDFGV